MSSSDSDDPDWSPPSMLDSADSAIVSQVTAKDLKKAGIKGELASKLLERQGEGKLQNMADFVVATHGICQDLKCEIEVSRGRKVRVKENDKGELVLEKVEQPQDEANGKHKIVKHDLIDLNHASKERLEDLTGVGRTLARRIVDYRKKHGPFKAVEELLLVRGITQNIVEKVSPEIRIDKKPEAAATKAPSDTSKVPEAGEAMKFNGREVIRMASWNLQCFSEAKAKNVGVKEVICRAILENRISIVAVQEIGERDALQQIKDELNNPTLKFVKKWKGHRGHWECITSDVAGQMFRSREYNGFLWDTTADVTLKSSGLLEKPKEGREFARRPYMGFFKARKFDFVLVSVHLKATGLSGEDLKELEKELDRVPDIVHALQEQLPGEKDMIIVGDFNLNPEEKAFDELRDIGQVNVIPGDMNTNISSRNMKGSKCYDNIWVGKHTRLQAFTERFGVLRCGMTHPAIPDGWKWGGVVSDHCPVWSEFYCDRDLDKSAGSETVQGLSLAEEDE